MQQFGLLIFALTLALSACAQYQPFESTPISDIPDGPGLFTGEEGEWVLYRKP